MKKVLDGVRADLRQEISEDVKTLIQRCWAGKPSGRPPFDHILGARQRIQFKVLPDIDSEVVKAFLADMRKEAKQMASKEGPKSSSLNSFALFRRKFHCKWPQEAQPQ
jgi:hypothetical protein